MKELIRISNLNIFGGVGAAYFSNIYSQDKKNIKIKQRENCVPSMKSLANVAML